MFNVLGFDRSQTSTARLRTPYKNTEGFCIELYYQLYGEAKLAIHVRGEDYIVQNLDTHEVPTELNGIWHIPALLMHITPK